MSEMLNPKPWYKSRAIIGGLLATIGSIGQLFGLPIPGFITPDLVLQLMSAIGGAVAVFGRVKATQPIGKKPRTRTDSGSGSYSNFVDY